MATGEEPIVASSTAGSPVSVDKLSNFVIRCSLAVLYETEGAEESLREAIANGLEFLKTFIHDPSQKTLVLKKESEGDEDRPSQLRCSFGLSVSYSGFDSIVFMKIGTIVEDQKPMHTQVCMLNFNQDTPLETLHSYMKDAVAPFFDSYVRSSGRAERDGDKLVPTVQKKFNELEVSLRHLQQNIDIPEVQLVVNADVMEAVKAAIAAKTKPSVDTFGSRLTNSTFLNALQKDVNRWKMDIQKVTSLDRDPTSGNALQEISFWLNLEYALSRIQLRRESPEIALTMDILKAGKRFQAVVGFDSDIQLKETTEKVKDYCNLMKDFPLNDLLAANSLDGIKSSITAIFQHMKRIRNTSYPPSRVVHLLEAISRDVLAQMTKVLGTHRLLLITYEDFEQTMTRSFEVFTCWDEEYDKLAGQLRDIAKRKRDELIKIGYRIGAHRQLQDRLTHLKEFRRQHEQLYSVITKVLVPSEGGSADGPSPTGDAPAIDEHFLQKEIVIAFDNVKVIDCLDLSPEGMAAWDAALKRYDERIDVVETRIAAHLRDQLGTAKNANEMFRIFSRYNALFVRAHIQGAIREYQAQLIQRVKEDIDGLHQKFKGQYAKSSAFRSGTARDIPPVAGSIIWAKQIDQQLTTYLQRVEAVLGKGWENHVEGQKLKADGDAFRQKLNTQQLFEEWKKKVESQPPVAGRIFAIGVRKTRTGELRSLQVNFQSDVIQLSKEVRNLRWMGFRVPLLLVNKSNQANQLYPHAVSLIDSVRTYEATCEKIAANEQVAPLVSAAKRDCQTAIQEGMQLEWSSFRLENYVRKFAEMVFGFQERVDEAIMQNEELEKEITQLASCDYSEETYTAILERVQKIVDDLSLHSYSNLPKWVAELDARVEEQLIKRLSDAITVWTTSLTSYSHDSASTSSVMGEEGSKGVQPRLDSVQLELRITNQVMYLNPPVEMARSKLIGQFHSWLSVITSLERIQSSRYQVGLVGSNNPSDASYSSLLGKLMQKDTQYLMTAFSSIDKVIGDVSDYVKVWLQYQSLWDMEQGTIYGHLGEDLAKWQQLLHEIKKSRATFDNTEIKKVFGPVMVHYGFVQKKVNDKYDTWHKDVLTRFGGMLGQNMQDFYGSVTKARTDLENHSVDAATTSEAVSFITLLQSLKRNMRGWELNVEVFRGGQKILDRQRFQYPSNWLYADNVDSEWAAFQEILKRKDNAMQTQVATLQGKIMAEDKAMEQRASDLLGEWEKGKPVQGNLRPDDALGKLQIFDGKFTRLKEERDNVDKAREALELDAGASSLTQDRILAGAEELQDLKVVWTELSKVWQKIDEMKEKPWITVAPRKIRQELEALLEQMKMMPNNLKTYSSYDYVLRMIKSYTKVNILVTELKSEALKDRHWKDLMKKLRVRWVMTDLILGQIWDVDLQRNEALVRDVILMAQGEMGLEVFLRQVREYWNSYQLEMVNYQSKCRLIKGWDDLFNKCKEHINQVAAMKLSPYYKVFEDEAVSWEDKLNRINALFDVWIDVQRRWVYLEGIFEGSTDIRHLLPTETQKFQSISTEFMSLMRRVAKSSQVMEVLTIPQVQKLLERLSDLLTKIQKALGEYLEKERAAFPRFYFVGDEDLMEIIGNSKNVARLQKHFKKMFAGVASVILNEDSTEVLGVTSREGEDVNFKKPVPIVDRRINEWLKSVEEHIRTTLAEQLGQSVESCKAFNVETPDSAKYLEWLDKYQVQVIDLTVQITWTANVELALTQAKGQDVAPLERVLRIVNGTMNVLADSVLQEQPYLRRKKIEHLITELVHQRGITRSLIKGRVSDVKQFEWLCQMRLYFDPKQSNMQRQLTVSMANANFFYGFEYLGVQEKLVQTPLTDRVYLTMTQALKEKLGGSPFGPAGTGKTESVKALGNQMGRFVLVFNCDERFDFQAMGRIFVGLCQVGAWGCFDEFNRLEERMLSAVSQQIQAIQEALKEQAHQTSEGVMDKTITVDLLGRMVKVSTDTGIFITMNPGYAGRSNLPDNLKQLFRSLAMTKPDRQLIAEVMLYSQGFRTAEVLSSKSVPFFNLCNEQLSNQSHYDFGLRALKSVLVSAGNVKRNRILNIREVKMEKGETLDEAAIAEQLPEQEILIQSICETMVPKLVAEDIPLLYSLLADVFPGVAHTRNEMSKLRKEVVNVCKEMHLVYGSGGDEGGNMWLEKVLQLYQIADLNHGLMMVGPSGSGKSTAWKVLLKALQNLEGTEGVAHVIDPKAITKEELYGVLDPNTREWTDGIFTHILRRIIDNVRGEIHKRQWIIFDGDVDPEWVENLNSVLDDNKLLTLPNGERLSLPPNVRIMFEVENLKYATLATVSRCGMVWFSEEVLTSEMIFDNFLNSLRHISIDEGDDYVTRGKTDVISPEMQVQKDTADIISSHFQSGGLVMKALEYAEGLDHIMEFTKLRVLNALFSMIHQIIRNMNRYNHTHPDFPMEADQLERYASRSLIYCLLWSFTGDSKLKSRQDLGNFIRSVTTISLPSASIPIIDYEVNIQGEWVPWQSNVPKIEVETHKVGSPDIVVPTLDTVRHESLLNTWLAEHKPMVLCGPPGSGKTMTLLSALRMLPDFEVIGLNFSSATTPELLLKTFEQYCEFRKTPNGMVMAPIQMGKWLVFFCDEINLPNLDKYGTQRVISFMRQIVEHNGFYRTSDRTWIKMERVQFVGACNPPTDPGRKPMSQRFLRHVPVVYVDYPGHQSLVQIYGTFNRAMLRLVPSLRTFADPLTEAMVEFYTMSQEHFTQDMQPHYVYSPRELTRWVKGIYEAVKPCENLSVEGLVRIWAHEALRLFQDRLIYDEERSWTENNINSVAVKYFPSIDRQAALGRPILFSDWLTKDYLPVNREELKEYVQARLKVFYEEELDVPLVLFDEVLEHVLRIDRIFKQQQGHLLLIGVSGSGKTTLSRFVAWINGLSIVQVKVHNKYTAADFDDDLRSVLRRTGCKAEKVVFIMDESNVLDSSFLERINTLLANGEVPGLFEGDELATLMTQCKEASQKEGLMLDSSEELYKWFTFQVMKNLHVVFTMNPSTEGLKDRASTSPALFNRCVLNWFGDWSTNAFYQVGMEFTTRLDIDRSDYISPDFFPVVYSSLPGTPTHRQAVVNAFVHIHQTMHQANAKLMKRGGNSITVSPRNYLDFIHHYVKLYNEKRSDLEEQQLHLNVGLQKIQDTVEQVEELQSSLSIKKIELEKKNTLANHKLKQMVHDQQEAEKKKATSQEIQEALHVQNQEISEKKEVVLTDLSMVEPTVREAEQAVQSIKKKDLVEVKNFPNPPKLVKLAMESICMLIGQPTTDWKAIRGIVMGDNFIQSVVKFQTDEMSDDQRNRMKREYLSDPLYNYENVYRASRACGPLVKWAIAQVSYADMLNKVEPLRNELDQLERDAQETRVKGEEIENLIVQLEKSIGQYKEEYANLISEANAIKTDLEKVETKVTRSKALLSNLAEEQERWKSGSEVFKSQMSTIVGDVLLTSGFIAYAGYFDQHLRRSLYSSWIQHLKQANISFRPDLARLEYLSTADDRLQWQKNDLPTDDLCVENAIMLKRFNRYPLIIDPSGQATEFLLNEYKGKKIMKTSFLDDAFRKNLESALRFGTPLLVQDVENYDPILNPVLNREVRRTGGRVLITLGDQDIDLSPSFTIFLSTRDPTAAFPPDLCSRVTFVNFTVTRGSLQSQCLHQVLKAERPDVDEKRSDLMKLQGEYLLRLRHLEQSLLNALNEAKGRILDNDDIISQLETLKREAGEVTRKMEETDVIMAEVERVSQEYAPLASSCSSIYFTIEGLSQIHFLYQFSLKFFLDVFSYVLTSNPKLKGVVDHKKRLMIITKELFQTVYNRVAQGMLHDDRIVLAMLLGRLFVKIDLKEHYNEEFEYLLRGKDSIRSDSRCKEYQGLSSEQVAAMDHLSENVKGFETLRNFISNQEFRSWLDVPTPERNVPTCWRRDDMAPAGEGLYQLLVVQVFRPDRLTAMMSIFISTVMGETFLQACEQEVNLATVVEEEISPKTPMILASVVGFDASGRVDDLAAQLSRQCTPVAMGSVEGFALAEKAISSASKTGRWVMLKNVHLAPQWLVQMEKKLHSISPHSGFRLFLTMEINPRVPVNLLRVSRIATFEPPPGVKANLLRTFSAVSATRMARKPVERAKMYFILAWLHAVIQERLHYAPLGWAKKYEFNESDLKMSCDTMDTWLDMAAQGRSNVPPEKIPWTALCTLLSQCIYGGRIDNDFDQKLLNNFVLKLFSSASFNSGFALMKDVPGLPDQQISMPEGIRREDFAQWIDALPDSQTPAWLGLPNTAQKIMLQSKGAAVITKLLKMQLLSDEEEVMTSLESEQGKKSLSAGDGRPSWMLALLTTAQKWIAILPQKLDPLRRTADSLKDPMFRFFEREISSGRKLLKIVCRDLLDVVKVCEGKMKQTNYLRTLINDLVKGIIPDTWKRYTVPPGLTVLHWVTDFSKRIEQLQKISALADKGGTKSLRMAQVWLGGLFSPEAYVTASRQHVAQENKWSLEELQLRIHVGSDVTETKDSFSILGLRAVGANIKGTKAMLTPEVAIELPLSLLSWTRVSSDAKPSANKVTLPFYLLQTRSELLFTADFEADTSNFYERGVAVVCSSL